MAPSSVASSVEYYHELQAEMSAPETPNGQQYRLPPVRHQMRLSAEKYNRNNK